MRLLLASQSDREKFGFSSLKFVFKEKQIFEVLKFVPLISLKENFTPFSESVKQMRTCKCVGALVELILGWVDSREAEGGSWELTEESWIPSHCEPSK